MTERGKCIVSTGLNLENACAGDYSSKDMAALRFWNQILFHFPNSSFPSNTHDFGPFPCSAKHFRL